MRVPINNAGIRFALVEDQEQVDKLLKSQQLPDLTQRCTDDPRGLRHYAEPGCSHR
jgi:long-chain acyl-CoA synthetase